MTTTDPSNPLGATRSPVTTTGSLEPTTTMWRLAGGLAIVHVVVMLAAVTQEPLVDHGQTAEGILEAYRQADTTRAFGAGYVEALSFMVLVPALVLIARALGRRTALSRWMSQTFLAFGVAMVASTLAVGFAPAAAAIHGSQHGADAVTVMVVNDVRNYAFVLQVALLSAMSLTLGMSALAERVHVRWIGWGGVGVGVCGLVATPFAHNAVSLLWLVWWVGLGVLFLRGTPRRT